MQNRIQDHKFMLIAAANYSLQIVSSKLFDNPGDCLREYMEDGIWKRFPREDYQIAVAQVVCQVNQESPPVAPIMKLQPLGIDSPKSAPKISADTLDDEVPF